MVAVRKIIEDVAAPPPPRGLIVDLFAGGGGASTGIEAATGRIVDIALNHDAVALRAHKLNHPLTKHLRSNVWKADPVEATGGLPVDILWASPDCTHHSVARGGKPRKTKKRHLADAVLKWVKAVKPRVVFLENVREFSTWGPLTKGGKIIKAKKGTEFRRWCDELTALGYQLTWWVLDSSLYGAPTRRKRLFLVARNDGQPITRPSPTHGEGLAPCHAASECIDWGKPVRSIFGRKKPLAEKTMWRIAQGLRRFVMENPHPFIVSIDQQGAGDTSASVDEPLSTVVTKNRHVVVTPHLVEVNHGKRQARGRSVRDPMPTITAGRRSTAVAAATMVQMSYGERKGQKARVLDLREPLGTIVAQGQKHGAVLAYLAKHFGDPRRKDGGGGVVLGQQLELPMPTVTTRDHSSLVAAALLKLRGQCHGADVTKPMPTLTAGGTHVAEVVAFLSAYYGEERAPGSGQRVDEPLRTIPTRDRFGLVMIRGTAYQIVDIGMRMLEPDELLRAQFGRFAEGYDLSAAKTKAKKVWLIGNSVPPEMAEALVRANWIEEARRAA